MRRIDMEKRNVVEDRRTPTQELVDPEDSIVKSAAAEFNVEGGAKAGGVQQREVADDKSE
jgi:hypothetical protein